MREDFQFTDKEIETLRADAEYEGGRFTAYAWAIEQLRYERDKARKQRPGCTEEEYSELCKELAAYEANYPRLIEALREYSLLEPQPGIMNLAKWVLREVGEER